MWRSLNPADTRLHKNLHRLDAARQWHSLIHPNTQTMSPYYYLFYKLSRFLNKKGNNEWGPVYAISLLIGWNIGMVYIKVLPITGENFIGGYKIVLIVILVSLFITNCVLFLNKKRVKEIMNRYKGESETSRKIGNFLVILYVVLSLGLIIFI